MTDSNQHSIRDQWEREVKPLVGIQGDGVGLGVAIITSDFEEALTGLLEQYGTAVALAERAYEKLNDLHGNISEQTEDACREIGEGIRALRGSNPATEVVDSKGAATSGPTGEPGATSVPATSSERVEAAVSDASLNAPSPTDQARSEVPSPASSPLALPVCPECTEGRHVYCLDDGSSTWTDKCRCTCRDEQSPATSDPFTGKPGPEDVSMYVEPDPARNPAEESSPAKKPT